MNKRGSQLEADVKATSLALKELIQRFPKSAFGLTPDAVKTMPEYKSLKAAFDQAFARLRTFNLEKARAAKEKK